MGEMLHAMTGAGRAGFRGARIFAIVLLLTASSTRASSTEMDELCPASSVSGAPISGYPSKALPPGMPPGVFANTPPAVAFAPEPERAFRIFAKQKFESVKPTYGNSICAALIGSIRYEFFEGTEQQDKVILYGATRMSQSRESEASYIPATLSMSPDLASALQHAIAVDLAYILHDELPGMVFSNSANDAGFILWRTDSKRMMLARWSSNQSASPVSVLNPIALKFKQDAVGWGDRLVARLGYFVAYLFALLPAFLLWRVRSILAAFDAFIPTNTMPGLLLVGAIYPATLAMLCAFVFYLLGLSVASVLYFVGTLVAVIGLVAAIVRSAVEPKIPFVPNNTWPARIFTGLRLTSVSGRHDAYLTLWSPHGLECEKCGLSYIVHTTSSTSEKIDANAFDTGTVPDDLLRKMFSDALTSSPLPVNACPRCENAEHVKAGRLAFRQRLLGIHARTVLFGALIIGVIAGIAAMLHYWRGILGIPVVGWMIEELEVLLFETGTFIPTVVGGLIFVGVLTAMSGRVLASTGQFFRIWGCKSDSHVLEDVHLIADGTTCPNCGDATLPLRRFVVR